MNSVIEKVSSNWHLMRIIRLIIGIMIIVQAIADRHLLLGILGAIFSSMAIFNVGCCGNNACTPIKKSSNKNSNEFTYEEVV